MWRFCENDLHKQSLMRLKISDFNEKRWLSLRRDFIERNYYLMARSFR